MDKNYMNIKRQKNALNNLIKLVGENVLIISQYEMRFLKHAIKLKYLLFFIYTLYLIKMKKSEHNF